MVANNAGEEKIETNANGKMEIIYLMIIFARQFPRLFLSNKAIFIMPDPLRHNDVFHFAIHILKEISKDLYVKIMMPYEKKFFFAIHECCEKGCTMFINQYLYFDLDKCVRVIFFYTHNMCIQK